MPRRSPSIYVGTSGWSYRDWPGRFYPRGLPPAQWLEYYCQHFDTVELNASFYRLPFENMIGSWNRRLSEEFHLVAKGHRRITHLKRLAEVGEDLEWFLERMLKLERLQILLWQLPPSLKQDLERLERFVQLLPSGVRHAVEFRHRSWWCDPVAELLSRYRVAFVAVSHPRLPDEIPATTDFLYLRFHGAGRELYRYDYDEQELRGWAEKARPFLAGRALYAYFNNDYQAHATGNARRFRELLQRTEPPGSATRPGNQA